jgi:hypothetical protein
MAYGTGVIYTNFNQRSLLTGAGVLTGQLSSMSTIILYYTNNGVGYQIPMQVGAGVSMTSPNIFPFSTVLSTNATFQFILTGSGNLTNVVNWKL